MLPMAHIKDQTNLRKREKAERYRARLRKQGLRPVQIWVPDTRARGFAEEVRRQSLLVARSKQEKEDIAFVEGLLTDNLDLPRA